MMRCNKTGLTNQDFKTILDVLNVYDPNDVIDHIPEMATPEFMQHVQSAFKAVVAHVNRAAIDEDPQQRLEQQRDQVMGLANQQFLHDS